MYTPDKALEIFGLRLRLLLENRKVSQTQVARQLKCGKAAVANWVNGISYPGVSTLRELSTILRVDPRWLLGLDNIDWQPAPDIQNFPSGNTYSFEFFASREKEFNFVMKDFFGERSPNNSLVITGQRGIGKSAFLKFIASSQYYFQQVFYLEMEKSGISLATLLDKISNALGLSLINPESSIEQKKQILFLFLAHHPVLIVINDFENVRDLSVVEFLLREFPRSSRILLATTELNPPFRRETVVHELPPLATKETKQLLKQWAAYYNVVKVLTADAESIEQLVRSAGGNPYFLQILLQWIDQSPRPLKDLLPLFQENEEALDNRYFVYEWKELSAAHRTLWLTMTLLLQSDGHSVTAIQAISGLDRETTWDALMDLVRLKVVKTELGGEEHHKYRLYSSSAEFALSKTIEDSSLVDQIEKARIRWAQFFLQYARENLISERRFSRYWDSLSRQNIIAIDREMTIIESVLAWTDLSGQRKLLVDLMITLMHYLDLRVLFDIRIRYSQRAVEAARYLATETGDPNWLKDAAILQIDSLGWTYLEQDMPDKAIDEIEQGLRIAVSLDTQEIQGSVELVILAHVWLARAYLLKLAKGGDKRLKRPMQDHMNKAELRIDECTPIVASRFYLTKGEIAENEKHDNDAVEFYRKGKDLRLALGIERAYENGYKLSEVLLRLHKYKEADDEAEGFLSKYGDPTTTIYTVRAEYLRARVFSLRNDEHKSAEKAKEWAELALKHLRQIHPTHPLLREIGQFLADLSLDKDKHNM